MGRADRYIAASKGGGKKRPDDINGEARRGGMPEDVYTSGADWDGRQCRAINLAGPDGGGGEGLGKITSDKKTVCR